MVIDKQADDFPERIAKLIKEVCPPKMNYTLRGELERVGLNENGRLKVQFVFIKTTYIQKVQKKDVQLAIAQAANPKSNHFLKDQRFDQVFGRYVFVIRKVLPEFLSLPAQHERFASE